MAPKILIVEDDKFLRQAYNNILSNQSFDVKIAADGKEGLDIANAWKPDVVLLDLLMPVMDGIDFLKAFNAPEHPETKIIVFSNLSMPEKVNEAITLGAVNFKTKAMFTPREMIALIRDTLATITPAETATTPTPESTPTA
jgi:CheY-like chemotaxis protein